MATTDDPPFTPSGVRTTGHCLCGSVSYAFEGEPAMVAICHCDDCQRHSGTAFSVNVVVPAAALGIDGSPKVHETIGSDSGETRRRLFCGDCGSPLFTMLTEQPDIVIIKAGTLDDRSSVAPTVEMWCRSALGWVGSDAARVSFEGDPQFGCAHASGRRHASLDAGDHRVRPEEVLGAPRVNALPRASRPLPMRSPRPGRRAPRDDKTKSAGDGRDHGRRPGPAGARRTREPARGAWAGRMSHSSNAARWRRIRRSAASPS